MLKDWETRATTMHQIDFLEFKEGKKATFFIFCSLRSQTQPILCSAARDSPDTCSLLIPHLDIIVVQTHNGIYSSSSMWILYFPWEIHSLYDLVFFENLLWSAAKKSNFGPLHRPRGFNETAAEVSLLAFAHEIILLNLQDGLYVRKVLIVLRSTIFFILTHVWNNEEVLQLWNQSFNHA